MALELTSFAVRPDLPDANARSNLGKVDRIGSELVRI
jgi:hypothetical protein